MKQTIPPSYRKWFKKWSAIPCYFPKCPFCGTNIQCRWSKEAYLERFPNAKNVNESWWSCKNCGKFDSAV